MCAWANSSKMWEGAKFHKNLHLQSCVNVLVSHITLNKLKLVCIETLWLCVLWTGNVDWKLSNQMISMYIYIFKFQAKIKCYMYIYILLLLLRLLSCVWLCHPINCRKPGFPVLDYILTYTHTHTHIYIGNIHMCIYIYRAFQVVLVVKNLPANAGGEGNGNPL